MRYNRRKSAILTIINDLANQSAAGYITYNPTDKKFFLPPENAMVLANEDSLRFHVRCLSNTAFNIQR